MMHVHAMNQTPPEGVKVGLETQQERDHEISLTLAGKTQRFGDAFQIATASDEEIRRRIQK